MQFTVLTLFPDILRAYFENSIMAKAVEKGIISCVLTDIRDFATDQSVDIILIDVSFISLREVLPHLAELANRQTQVVAMVKPQFETGNRLKNRGVIKNDTERRRILHDFEQWAKRYFLLRAKADSAVAGARGNRERFYLLTKLA